jgi:hypothetical protein
MKIKALFLIAGTILTGPMNGQTHLFLEEQEVNLEDGKCTAWVFPVARDLEEAFEDLKEYCRDRSDLKLKKEGDNLMIAEKISLPTIATKRGDLIGYCYITEQYYAMALIFKLGYDITLNSQDWKPEMVNLRNYAKAFMAYHYEQSYARRLNILEKDLKDLEKERDQNEVKINNMTDKINNLGKKIGKETEIRTLEADIKTLMDTLPGLESKIADLQKQVSQNKTESNAFQGIIGAL